MKEHAVHRKLQRKFSSCPANSAKRVFALDVPGIHVFPKREIKTWMAGHRRAEATPSFGRLCPAMTTVSDVYDKLGMCVQVRYSLSPNSAANRFSPARLKLTTRLPGAVSRAAHFNSVKRVIR